MRNKDFLKAIKEHGIGEKQSLAKEELSCFLKCCNSFRKVLVDGCLSHALYRCTLTCNEGIVFLDISGADDKGNMKALQVAYNLDDSEVIVGSLEFEDNKEVGDAIYNLLLNLSNNLDYEVGMLDIPLEGVFEEGIRMGYNKEIDTMFILIKDSLDYSYFTEF